MRQQTMQFLVIRKQCAKSDNLMETRTLRIYDLDLQNIQWNKAGILNT